MKQTITIGTRGSQLALWQAEYVRKRLNDHFPARSIKLKVIKTTGDKIRDRSLVGLGKGVFTKEIEIALLDGTIDLAVHSMKDLPTDLPDGLCIAAIPGREDPRDVLVTQSGLLLDQLRKGRKLERQAHAANLSFYTCAPIYRLWMSAEILTHDLASCMKQSSMPLSLRRRELND